MNLYPFQREGVAFLKSQRRAYLAWSMGMGKSVGATVAARELGITRALVVAPASAIPNWEREWGKWYPGFQGVFKAISYSKLLRDPNVVGDDWDLVILDEAHMVKNPKAKRTRAALDVARKADRAFLLSGTPMPNHAAELFAPIRVLWPEIAHALNATTYRKWFDTFTYWTMTKYGKRPYAMRNADKLRPYLKQIMLRRTVQDVALDLPPLRVDVSLLPNDERFARTLEEAGVDPENLEKRIEAEDTEEGSASRLRRLLGEYKAPHIAKILARELEDREYQKIVVLAYHKSVLATLREGLSGFGVTGFDGSTRSEDRQDAIDAFTEDPSVRVFVAQQTAAGVAINLQAASEIVLVEPAWTPSENDQAIKRVHRIGSEDPVRARIFAVAGTLDETVMNVVRRKTLMLEEVGL